MIDVRPVLFVNGFLLLVLAGSMGIPAVLDALALGQDWRVFLASAGVTGFVALALILGARPSGRFTLDTRQAFLLTFTAWLFSAAFGALPFLFSGMRMSLVDGVFEATSGLTTTGATVMAGLDRAPRSILLWRALLNWLGGLGIVVAAVALLPMLRIGGMALFKMESSDKTDRVRPRTSKVAVAITGVYAGFTVLSAVLLALSGMAPFDAVCHALSALSTGGFSTSDQNFGHWGEATQWVGLLSMMAGGLTFSQLLKPSKRSPWPILADSQVHWYLAFLGFFAVLLGLWRWASSSVDAEEAFRHASFTVVSLATTTGFRSDDYASWGGFAQVTAFILTFIGGCTGSPSGGVKVFRWQVLFAMAGVHLKRLLHPHGVFVINFNRQTISDAVVESVLGLVVLYFLTFSLYGVALAAVGLDWVSSLSASAAALANCGPGLGSVATSYRGVPDAAKWVLASEMLVGRLELFTVYVLCTRTFWRR